MTYGAGVHHTEERMSFDDEVNMYADAAHELVVMRAKFRADKEEQVRREALLWLPILDDPEMTNDRKRKAAYEAMILTDEDYQDLLGAIQIQHDAIAHREVDEQFHLMWARYLTAIAVPEEQVINITAERVGEYAPEGEDD